MLLVAGGTGRRAHQADPDQLPSQASLARPMSEAKTINRLFLSGWEYNRLLQQNPLTSRVSALPSSVLWNGAAQFWLFEEAVCTVEALENEQAAGEALGWATARIYDDLKTMGALRTIDLGRDLSPGAADELVTVHRRLRAGDGDPSRVRKLLRDGDGAALEGLKQQLLQPVVEDQGCVLDGDPNGLLTWFAGTATRQARADVVRRSLESLVRPLQASKRNLGLQLCRPLGQGLPAEAVENWRQAQHVEREMISEFLAGEGPFSGPRGHVAYFDAMSPYRSAYEPIEGAVEEDWRRNRPILEALRDRARKHLWPQLHEEWIPQLKAQDPQFIEEFPKLLRRAILLSPVAELLNLDTHVVMAITTGSALGIAHVSGVDSETTGAIAAVTGAAAVAAHNRVQSRIGPLALFYQRARTVTRLAQRRSKGR